MATSWEQQSSTLSSRRKAIAQDEVFGPVLNVIRGTDAQRFLQIVHQSRYETMACIFSSCGRSAREFRTRVEAGMMGINGGVPPHGLLPVQWVEGIFLGDLNATGRDAVEFYTAKRVVTSHWQ